MPTDGYFRTQQYLLPEVLVAECTEEHGCCCDCDGCPGGEWERPYGPVPPVQYGPWEYSMMGELNGLLMQRYAAKLYTKLLGLG